MSKLTPEEQSIFENWENLSGEGFIRPDSPSSGGRVRLTVEEQHIRDRADGIIPIEDETEPPVARDRREVVEAASRNPGEEPIEGQPGVVFAGGVAAGMTFVLRRADGAPTAVMMAPIFFDESRSYENYAMTLGRDADGEISTILIAVNHHPDYINVFTPEQYGLQVPKPLRGQLTVEGKQMMKSLVQAGAMKPAEPKDAPRPAMPTKPFTGFKPVKKK